MPDKRAQTSRANLGEHIPEALGDGPSTVIAVRVPPELLEWIDRLRGDATRSEFLRGAAAQAVDFARHPMNYTALLLGDEEDPRDDIAAVVEIAEAWLDKINAPIDATDRDACRRLRSVLATP